MNWCDPWITVFCHHCGGQISVDKVDEDHIEESGMNPDFVEGDNWVHDGSQTDHEKYIPDHHIFISKGLFKIGIDKVMKTLSHELCETAWMLKGLSYEAAHERANKFETEVGKEFR